MNIPVPCCEYCGAEKPEIATFQDLTVSATFGVRYKDQTVSMQPAERLMLYKILRRGTASLDSLAVVSNSEFLSNEIVRHRICTIRRKMKEAGIPYRITTIYGYGYGIEATDRDKVKASSVKAVGLPARSSSTSSRSEPDDYDPQD